MSLSVAPGLVVTALVASASLVLAGGLGVAGVVAGAASGSWVRLGISVLVVVSGCVGYGCSLGAVVRAVERWRAPLVLTPVGVERTGLVRAVRGAVIVCLLMTVGAAVVAGLLSVLVFVLAGPGLGPDGLRRVINGVGLVLALLVGVLVFAVSVLGAAGVDVRGSWLWAVVRQRFLGLLGLAGVAACLGAVLLWLTGLWSAWWLVLARWVLLVVLGAVVLLAGVLLLMGAGPELTRGLRLRLSPAFRLVRRRRPTVSAGVVVLGLGLVAGLVPAGVAGASPVDATSETPERPATTQPVGEASNSVPESDAASVVVAGEPYDWYDVPGVAGPVVAGGDGWVTYQLGERSFQTVLGGVQSTFVDESGEVQEVDNTLIPDPESGALVNEANGFSLSIPVAVTGEGIRFSRDGFELVLTPQSGDFSHAVVRGNAVLFSEVFPGIDVQYTLIGSVLKEDIVLTRLVDVPQIAYRVTVGEGLALAGEAGAGLVARALADRGDVASGDVVFGLSAPVMVDGAGAVSDGVELTSVVDGGSALMSLVVAQQWVADPLRVFPVRIDPVVDIAPQAVSLVGVEQGAPDARIGDNDFPYAGYDDGVVSKNLINSDIALLETRTYVALDYDFAQIMREARIDSAWFSLDQTTNWSNGATVFDLYAVDGPWDPATITWNSQLGLGGTFLASTNASAVSVRDYISWDVRELVNNWVQGIVPQYGLRVQASSERWMQAEVFSNMHSDNPPRLSIDWSIPDPVDPSLSLSSTTVSVRAVTEKNTGGKQIVDGVFADGLAQPDSWVAYGLDPTGQGAATQASRSLKFPNSGAWEASLPGGTRYADKLSNWQSGLYGQLDPDVEYRFKAVATDAAGVSGGV
ncbi:MAG: DNRLRE domain-containing protein, partial [Propionibacteriaceae bacterium]|nr:DNRLRE domain-containing protein [Propionibacteriaceae bacterium]